MRQHTFFSAWVFFHFNQSYVILVGGSIVLIVDNNLIYQLNSYLRVRFYQVCKWCPYLVTTNFADSVTQRKREINILRKKKQLSGFPGGAVVENLPAKAGATGSSPGPGRSHLPRSNWVREPQLLSLRVWSLCSATREAAIMRSPRTAMKSGPRLPQLEKALAQKRRPNTAINK